MSKVAVFAITKGGKQIAKNIYDNASQKPDIYLPAKHINMETDFDIHSLNELPGNLEESISLLWNKYNAFIFIMATGIVVRSICKQIKHKAFDPAVVVIDEKGQFAISLISGHIGGANSLAIEVSSLINCQPVVTTATDVSHITGIDSLANSLDITIEPLYNIKSFNMHLLENGKLHFWLDDNIIEKFSEYYPGSYLNKIEDYNGETCSDTWHVFVTNKNIYPLPVNYIYWRPKDLVLGVGCKKDICFENLWQNISEVFNNENLSLFSIKEISSIDIKVNEKAILELKKSLKVPFSVFNRNDIQKKIDEENNLSFSNFVKERIGVEGVCEPVALLAAKNGQLIKRKNAYQGTTIAIAKEKSLLLEPGLVTWLS